MNETKTIFIVITRSFLIRTVLRSGTLDLLLKAGYRAVMFFPTTTIPDVIRKEFESDRVSLHGVDLPFSRLHKTFLQLRRYILDTDTIRVLTTFEVKNKSQNSEGITIAHTKPAWRIKTKLFFVWLLSKIGLLKKLFRFIERHVFTHKNSQIISFFNTYRPDVVLSTSVVAHFDTAFMKEASRRGIPTVAIPKGWDNVVGEYYPFVPDYIGVHNQISKDLLQKKQDIEASHIHLVGFPQFDWYRRPEILRSREDHLSKMGLDPSRAVIFFGSEGVWAANDFTLAEKILGWIDNNELTKPAQLLVRPHYSNVRRDVFGDLRGRKHVVVDDFQTLDFLIDKWNPTNEETIDFVNSVAHCDVMINVASTLSFDAACLDRPIILVGFGCEYENNKDVTVPKLYGTDHIQWLEATKGAIRADSLPELKAALNAYLENPRLHEEGRARIREDMCYKVDGKASKRLFDLIELAVKEKFRE